MPYRDFREYVTALEKEGEVQRIQQEVDWDMEAGAITRRSYEIKARAPFFQKIKDYPEGYRIFGAPLSSTKRIALTMEMDPDSSFMELSHEFRRRTRNPIKPIVVKDGPCKENIQTGDDINLFQFPAPMVHDGDGGRYICTWHVDVNQDPDSDWVNWGMYRKMIHNKNTMGGIMLPFQHMPYIFFNKYEAKGKPMEFATAIAPEPVVTFAGCTMFPAGVTEADMAGAIRKEPVELVKCETVDLYVPATSEIVFEGYVSPHERIDEGPFGEYTGYRASPREPRPVFHITAVTYRNDPILTMSCMGVPVDDCQLQMAVTLTAVMWDELVEQKQFPITDIRVVAECCVFLTIISTKTPYTSIAHHIATAFWGTKYGAHCPYLIVVNDDIDVMDMDQVMHAVTTKCHPVRGLQVMDNTPGQALFPFLSLEERLHGKGKHVLFDCTWPLDWDPAIAVPPRASFDAIYPKDLREKVLNNWSNYGY